MDHYYRRAEGFGALILLQDLMKTDACRCGGGDALRATPTSAEYATLHSKIRWRKVKTRSFSSGKWFYCSCTGALTLLAEASKSRSKPVHLLEKSVINRTWLLLPGFHWLKSVMNIILTAPPCFWLAKHNDWSRWSSITSSHLFAVLVSVLLGGGCEKVKN